MCLKRYAMESEDMSLMYLLKLKRAYWPTPSRLVCPSKITWSRCWAKGKNSPRMCGDWKTRAGYFRRKRFRRRFPGDWHNWIVANTTGGEEFMADLLSGLDEGKCREG